MVVFLLPELAMYIEAPPAPPTCWPRYWYDTARQARIKRLAGMQTMGYSRDHARMRLVAEGATPDNNEWAEAGKLLKAPRSAE